MKYLICISFLASALLVTGNLAACDVKTIGDPSYTLVELLAGYDIYEGAVLSLIELGFDYNGTVGDDLEAIATKFRSSYGGLLLWASHGAKDAVGNGYIAIEQYGSHFDATNRIEGLLAMYAAGDLDISQPQGQSGYWVCLTDQGINALFDGDDAIALVAACYGGRTGKWGARDRVGYNDIIYPDDAQAHMTDLIDCMAAANSSYDSMTVGSALQLGQSLNGDGKTSLIPWVVSFDPDPNVLWTDSLNTVTISFGARMQQIDNPIGVSGSAIVRSNKWNSACEAAVKIRCGWEMGTIRVSLDAASMKGEGNGPSMREGMQLDYCCFTDDYPDPRMHGSTWSKIKTQFFASSEVSYAQAISNDNNILVWSEFGNTSSDYSILRRIGDEQIVSHIGTNERGDTIYVDSDVSAGYIYHYRIVSDMGDTLEYSNECSAGLTNISESIEEVDYGWCYALTTDGEYLYAAYQSSNSSIISKIDISNPLDPVVVGSRTIPDSDIRSLELVYYGGYLLCMDSDRVLLLYKMAHDLPVVSEIALPYDQFYEDRTSCSNMCAIGNTAFVARGDSGLTAINFAHPTNLKHYGTYYGPGGLGVTSIHGVEAVDGFLYIRGQKADYSLYSEIVEPGVNEIEHICYFNQICSDIEQPVCTDPPIRLVPETAVNLVGNPAGYYALGQISDYEFSVLNTADPSAPVLLNSFQSPFPLDCLPNGWCFPYLNSYTFDDRFIYMAGRRNGDEFGRIIFIYDIYSLDSIPTYVIGDTMAVNSVTARGIVSWGSYLYCIDRVRSVDLLEYYNRLRIFEKARGCETDLSVSVMLDPIASQYEVGQNMNISWNSDGCPDRVHIKLAGDIPEPWTLAQFTSLDGQDLSSGSFNWVVEGLEPDYEDYTYYILVSAWNIEGRTASGFSSDFEIVEELSPDKEEKIPILGLELDDGTTRTYPLPGLSENYSGDSPVRWIFPANPRITDGKVSFSMQGCTGKRLHVDAMQLYSLDVPPDCKLSIIDSEPVIVRDGKVRGVYSALIDEAESDNGQGPRVEARASELRIKECGDAGPFVLRGDETIDLCYTVPQGIDQRKRYYILAYGGSLFDEDPGRDETAPSEFRMMAPYPNPFNPSISLKFDLPRAAHVKLRVYNVKGELVTVLIDRHMTEGRKEVTWNGIDAEGRPVASGVYFYRFIAGDFVYTKKMVLLR